MSTYELVEIVVSLCESGMSVMKAIEFIKRAEKIKNMEGGI